MYISESYGSDENGGSVAYCVNQSNILVQEVKHSQNKYSVKNFFQAVFLPKGYPESVSKDYLAYQVWDTVQAFCSSITGTLATHAVLKGSGVGDETATAAAATITWLLKDGTGMVGRIAFAYCYGTSLDANAKQWRLFADVLNDCAICVQLLAPLFPKVYFTPIMCTAGLAFSLVGVAGGCTRAALTMHQAKRNNMADVSAKDGSQETLVNLAALLTSLMITPYLSNNTQLTWLLFVTFTLFHIYANFQAVSCVVMETFNRLRFAKAVNDFIQHKQCSPAEGNSNEPLLFPSSYSWLKLGCRLEELQLGKKNFDYLYSIAKEHDTRFLIASNRGSQLVALEKDATSKHVLMACYSAYMRQKGKEPSTKECLEFLQSMKNIGWDISKHHMCVDEWRWSTQEGYPNYGAKPKLV